MNISISSNFQHNAEKIHTHTRKIQYGGQATCKRLHIYIYTFIPSVYMDGRLIFMLKKVTRKILALLVFVVLVLLQWYTTKLMCSTHELYVCVLVDWLVCYSATPEGAIELLEQRNNTPLLQHTKMYSQTFGTKIQRQRERTNERIEKIINAYVRHWFHCTHLLRFNAATKHFRLAFFPIFHE